MCVLLRGMGIEVFQKKLGKQIAIARKKAGFSQSAFALRIDKDRQWVNYLEKGKGNPTIKTLYMIAGELGITLKELFDFN